MRNKDEMLASVKKTLSSGYYEIPRLEHPEKKSLLEAIEKKREAGIVPVIAMAGNGAGNLKADIGGICDSAVAAGACGVCIPIEPSFLGGDIHLLEKQWNAPVLVSDFVIDERQMAGGDAVLLITSLLDAAGANQNVLIEAAHERGFEAVLQVGNGAEFARAIATEADMILVGCRDFWSDEKIDFAGVVAGSSSGRIVIAECGCAMADGGAVGIAGQGNEAKAALAAGAKCILQRVAPGKEGGKITAPLQA